MKLNKLFKSNSKEKQKEEDPKYPNVPKNEFDKLRNKLLNDWVSVMVNTKTYNLTGNTFTIANERITNYGWEFKVLPVAGLTLESLETLTPYIKSGLGCAYFLYNISESNKSAMCKIIYSENLKINTIPFEPYKVKPYELYFGNSADGTPIIVDVNICPHVLLAGQTRRGKNGSLSMALISLMAHNSPKDVEIYYYQASKSDGAFFKYCPNVYAYADNDLSKFLTMLNHVVKVMDKRGKLIEPYSMEGANIVAYNRHHQSNRMSYIYVVCDEFLACTVDPKVDSKETKSTKLQIQNILQKIAQYGASTGVTYIISHQKPSKENLSSFLKNQSNTRICFGYDDRVCSDIVLGTSEAWGLPPRRAILSTSTQKELIFTTNLSGKIEEFVKANSNPNRPDLFEDLKKKNEKINKNNEFIKDLIKNGNKNIEICDNSNKKDKNYCEKAVKIATKEDYIKSKLEGKVNKKPSGTTKPKKDSKEEAIIKAIKNNPNYVPYNEKEREIINMIKLENEKKES